MKIKLFRSKKVYNYICRLLRNSWQDFQYVNGTFEELDEFNIQEIRELLDEPGPTLTQPDT